VTTKFAWSGWQSLPGNWSPDPAILAETLDGGQSFRWHCNETTVDGADSPHIWTGLWSDHLAQLRLNEHQLEWRAPVASRSAAALSRYLAQEVDWPALTDSLPWRSDPHLAQCLTAFPALRLLRQPFGETLLGFLCSATKQIVQIKQMVALLAERHGSPLLSPSTLNPQLSTSLYRLPTWAELAAIPESDLRQCLLGFRAKYIHATARYLAVRPGWLEETETLPYAAAKARLLELPGVGEKVADCVLLFGAGKL
jgi:N-glycosylase/DNA lyase